MIGILFGFTALDAKKPYHYSHVTGVTREYQSRGVGFRLKLAQRKHVIGQGQDLVRWTFDPLQANNAYFNVGKLGVICRTYERNMYGRLDDSLNRGRVTDRFEAEWWVRSRRVRERIRGKWRPMSLGRALSKGAVLVNPTKGEGMSLRVMRTHLGLTSNLLLVEIPQRIGKVAEASLDTAHRWTMEARRVFEKYFRRRYVVTDIVLERTGSERRVFYLMTKNFPVE